MCESGCIYIYSFQYCLLSFYTHYHHCNTVEPPNKGHFGRATFVLYSEAVLWWDIQIMIESTIIISIGAIASVLYIEVVLWWEGPL